MFIDKLGRKPLLIGGVAGIAVCMLVLSYGFKDASYQLTEDSIKALPEQVEIAKLAPMIDVVYDSDLDFKEALEQNLGNDIAETYQSELITAAVTMNAWLILIGILGFVASFAISIGPVMWVLFSELFPLWIRGIAISFVGLVNSAISFLVQLVFPWELANLGSSLTFMLYGLFAIAGLVFIVLKVPETKGKSLEELEKQLVK